MTKKLDDRTKYKDAPMEVKNQLAKQYEPLLHKITRQFFGSVPLEYNDLFSMAEEGFVEAINIYDPKISKMNFTQYAAYAIRNKILCGVTAQSNVVTMNGYAVAQLKSNNECVNKTIGMTTIQRDHNSEKGISKEYKFNLYSEDNLSQNPWELLFGVLDKKFSKEDMYLFYSFYGLKDFEQKSATLLAKEYEISVGAISQKTKKVLNYIKSNEGLKNVLIDLLA